jgi:hypothetical protein
MWNLVYTRDFKLIYFQLDPIGVEVGTNHILESFEETPEGHDLALTRMKELGIDPNLSE